ncbi:hypothetical protein KSS87_007584 [Heliosperma pusillum]|nr:hypothetical protein KSS87_008600 [Heliosperma pusillum]KAH9622401.1 hypothetical protein KSS87_007584 [Heliosperma pusillum]
MEALTTLSGLSNSIQCSITTSTNRHLSLHRNNHHLNHRNLAAFHSNSHYFSYSPKCPRLSAKPTKTHIFLPHLVASMVGEIISRFEKKGFKLIGLKMYQCPKQLAEEHYKDLNAKSFYQKLIDYITSGPVVCMAWEGVGAVASSRKLIGATDPLQAEPGTIRGDLAVQTGRNVIHGSDSPDNGKREIGNYFYASLLLVFLCFSNELNAVESEIWETVSGSKKMKYVSGLLLKHPGLGNDFLPILRQKRVLHNIELLE